MALTIFLGPLKVKSSNEKDKANSLILRNLVLPCHFGSGDLDFSTQQRDQNRPRQQALSSSDRVLFRS